MRLRRFCHGLHLPKLARLLLDLSSKGSSAGLSPGFFEINRLWRNRWSEVIRWLPTVRRRLRWFNASSTESLPDAWSIFSKRMVILPRSKSSGTKSTVAVIVTRFGIIIRTFGCWRAKGCSCNECIIPIKILCGLGWWRGRRIIDFQASAFGIREPGKTSRFWLMSRGFGGGNEDRGTAAAEVLSDSPVRQALPHWTAAKPQSWSHPRKAYHAEAFRRRSG